MSVTFYGENFVSDLSRPIDSFKYIQRTARM